MIQLQPPDLLGYDEAARQLHMSRPNIYAMVQRGQLHSIVIGKHRFLLRLEVERLAAQRQAR